VQSQPASAESLLEGSTGRGRCPHLPTRKPGSAQLPLGNLESNGPAGKSEDGTYRREEQRAIVAHVECVQLQDGDTNHGYAGHNGDGWFHIFPLFTPTKFLVVVHLVTAAAEYIGNEGRPGCPISDASAFSPHDTSRERAQ
jgi:hypothetical protein